MRPRALFAIVAVSVGHATAWAAPSAPHVTLTPAGVHRVHVEGQVVVPAGREVTWRVLTDYDHLAGFIPGLRECRLLRTTPTRQLLQRGVGQWLVFRRRIDVLFEVTEVPMETIAFRAVGGDFVEYDGRWRLEPTAGGTRIAYEATLRPRFFLPPVIGGALLQRQLRDSLRAIAAEVARRSTTP